MRQVQGRTLRTDSGAYQVYEVVAVGGFASVYYGRDLTTNAPVAVKLLHPHFARNETFPGIKIRRMPEECPRQSCGRCVR